MAADNQMVKVAENIRGKFGGRRKVKLQRAVSGRVVERVRNRELDGGFMLCSKAPEGVNAIPLMDIELAVALPRTGGVDAAHLSWQNIADIPWISSVSGCILNDATRTVFDLMGSHPQAYLIANSDGALQSMVASRLGAAVLRRSETEDGVRSGEMDVWPHWKGSVQLCWISAHSDISESILCAISAAVKTVRAGQRQA